tara:strand:+ start:267 stop:479 length:213 start_codon:yes stop_codon:yes gene_type:complete
MLIHEFTQTHNKADIETRIYLNLETKSVAFYQYTYKKDKVLDINSINIPIKEFGKLTKMALKSYILLMQK